MVSSNDPHAHDAAARCLLAVGAMKRAAVNDKTTKQQTQQQHHKKQNKFLVGFKVDNKKTKSRIQFCQTVCLNTSMTKI